MFALSSYWLLVIFTFVLIDRCDDFGFDFTTLNRKALYMETFFILHMNLVQGRSQDFSKVGGGGGHTVSNIIVMAFSARNIVGCFLKKRLTTVQRGDHGHPRTPLATPL